MDGQVWLTQHCGMAHAMTCVTDWLHSAFSGVKMAANQMSALCQKVHDWSATLTRCLKAFPHGPDAATVSAGVPTLMQPNVAQEAASGFCVLSLRSCTAGCTGPSML